jgi:putative FmdB family regulatory protein
MREDSRAMPLFEYRCEACGVTVEELQAFSASPLERCETCGGPLKKLISSAAVQFKGTGWYVSDYARAASAKNGSGETTPASETKAEGETKAAGEAKPAPDAKPASEPAAKPASSSAATPSSSGGEKKGE